jgi:hypothetical protein
MGLPNFFDQTGRAVAKKILGGQVKIRGLLLHPVALTRLTIILAVN